MKPFLVLFACLLLFRCAPRKTDDTQLPGEPHGVLSVNYPLHYLVERIGTEDFRAEFIIPSGLDPAFWKPTMADVQRFQQAKLIVDNGADYAKWMSNASLPQTRILDTSSEFKDMLLASDQKVMHSHGSQGEHSHGGSAFTVWLDFELYRKQALAVLIGLIKLQPDQEQLLRANFLSLETDLKELHRQMSEAALPLQGQTVLASHPVYQYLGRAYGFETQSEHWEPDAMPDTGSLASFENRIAGSSRIMLWEAEPLPELSKWLIQNRIVVVVFEPCGNQPDVGDLLGVMKQNINNLKEATSDMPATSKD